MASSPAIVAFNYADLDAGVRMNVETATRRLHDLERRTSESIIEIGHTLIDVKKQIGHGNFLPWIEAEFGWSERSARSFMQVAETFKSAKFADLKSIGPSALCALAAPSTPEEVRAEFTGLAAIGQRVTHKDVREAIATRRQPSRAEAIPVDDWDDDGPIADVPYEVVDLDSGELFGPGVVSRTVAYQPTAEQGQVIRPSRPNPILEPTYNTPEQNANQIAAHLTMHHGKEQARRIAFAILDQTGGRS